MRNLDFLSEFPRTFIFQKEVNKTNFGGVLFLIYGIIMIIISLSYILDFYLNDKFEIEYSSINSQTTTLQSVKLDNNPDYNPMMQFKFSVGGESLLETLFDGNFKIAIFKNDTYAETKDMIFEDNFPFGYQLSLFINSSVSDLRAKLVYFCGNDKSCSINEEKYGINENTTLGFAFQTTFPKIDSQNPEKPIIYDENNRIYESRIQYSIFQKCFFRTLKWKVVKFIEKKGLSRIFDKLLDRKVEYFTGYFSSEKVDRIDSYIDEDSGNYYKMLMAIDIDNPHDFYDEYKRRRITELDVLSTISALFSPIKLIFSFIYGFYSSNFNNYKIIENILNPNFKSNKLIQLKNCNQKKDSSFKDLNDNENQENLITTGINEDNDDINDNEDINDSEAISVKKERILPKYSFMQFFLNNIYCKSSKKCGKYKDQQEIIYLCNAINMKYLSIDSILYNQIMIENLLEDYNWNNTSLNSIKNNELILKIKNLIE